MNQNGDTNDIEGGRKGDMGEVYQTKKEVITKSNLRKNGTLDTINKQTRKKSDINHRKGDHGLLHILEDYKSLHHSHTQHKKDELYKDAIALYQSQDTSNPSINSMHVKAMLEQRDEKQALQADSVFEEGAMESLKSDERAMNTDEDKVFEDERRVEEDRKRKFGKHRKENNKDDLDTRSPKERLPAEDLNAKIEDFVQSLSPMKKAKNVKSVKQKRDYQEFEDNESVPWLNDNTLKEFAGEDENDVTNTIETSSTPSQILGNIASIFEEQKEEKSDNVAEALVRRKDTIPRPGDDKKYSDDVTTNVMRKDMVSQKILL